MDDNNTIYIEKMVDKIMEPYYVINKEIETILKNKDWISVREKKKNICVHYNHEIYFYEKMKLYADDGDVTAIKSLLIFYPDSINDEKLNRYISMMSNEDIKELLLRKEFTLKINRYIAKLEDDIVLLKNKLGYVPNGEGYHGG